MGGYEYAAHTMHLVIDAVDVDINGVQQVVLLLAYYLIVLVDYKLVSEAVFIVGDVRQVRIQKLLEGIKLRVRLEEA